MKCGAPSRSAASAEATGGFVVFPAEFAHKKCGADGRWEGRPGSGGGGGGSVGGGGATGGDGQPGGVGGGGGGGSGGGGGGGGTVLDVSASGSAAPQVLVLMKKLLAGPVEAAATKLAIAARTRTLEIVGLSVSLAALLLSLAIFCRFRSLRNNRTRIHKHLFVAMVIQVVIRLTLYIDQAVLRGGAASAGVGLRTGLQGINTPGLCEVGYVLLEYARTAMFMWMFVEGLYLHNMITVSVFQEHAYYAAYPLLGWGAPVVMTTAWAVTTGLRYGPSKCWYGYNLTYYFWILEGPRLGVVVLNLLFLLNIIRVLVLKLRQSRTSELEQVR
ncbi:PDF receptor [Gryllus bimaculatus]|nr:PDF receptor [Gryllus bimaculatus]